MLEGRQPTSAEVMQYMDLSGLRLPYNKPRQEPPPRDDDDDPPPPPPPPPWQPYAAQGGVWADEDDEEEYYDEWTNGPRERTALEEPGPVILRAQTSRDAPIPQTTGECVPHPEKSSSPTVLGRCPEGAEGSQRSLCNEDHVGSPSGLRPPSPQAGKGLEKDASDERTKISLGDALARLCRAGIEAVTGSPGRTCLDVVSRLSHHAHPMPILRAFWRNDRVSPAALPRLGCLMSGLRISLPDSNVPMRLLSS
jgi:hypothetical protein